MAGADPDLARIRALRIAIANRIEADIALLDAIDRDSDLEAGGDDEPSLGSIGGTWLADYHPQTGWARGSLDDRENAECEDCDGEARTFGPIRVRA